MRHAGQIGTALLTAALGALPLAASAQTASYDGGAGMTTAAAPASLSGATLSARSIRVVPVDVDDVPGSALPASSDALQASVIGVPPPSWGNLQQMTLGAYLAGQGIDPSSVVGVRVAPSATAPSRIAHVTVYVDRSAMGTVSS